MEHDKVHKEFQDWPVTWIRRENAASGPKGLQLGSSREYRFCEAFYHR